MSIALPPFDLGLAARVLDAGCGYRPFPFATHFMDLRDVGEVAWRGFARSRFFIRGSIEALPFADGTFDFVYCAHVLEHVRNPAAACAELSRVGRRGYVECPKSWSEYLFEATDHRWLVDLDHGRLVFREKLDDERGDHVGVQYKIFDWLNNPVFVAYWNAPAMVRARTVRLLWSDQIPVSIVPRTRRRSGHRLNRSERDRA
jgi:SAM-dependent methyltransferase